MSKKMQGHVATSAPIVIARPATETPAQRRQRTSDQLGAALLMCVRWSGDCKYLRTSMFSRELFFGPFRGTLFAFLWLLITLQPTFYNRHRNWIISAEKILYCSVPRIPDKHNMVVNSFNNVSSSSARSFRLISGTNDLLRILWGSYTIEHLLQTSLLPLPLSFSLFVDSFYLFINASRLCRVYSMPFFNLARIQHGFSKGNAMVRALAAGGSVFSRPLLLLASSVEQSRAGLMALKIMIGFVVPVYICVKKGLISELEDDSKNYSGGSGRGSERGINRMMSWLDGKIWKVMKWLRHPFLPEWLKLWLLASFIWGVVVPLASCVDRRLCAGG